VSAALLEPGARHLGRSVAAVVLGFFATAALSMAVDVVLHQARVFPPWGQVASDGLLALATAYRVAFTVLGGYLTARLAPQRPMRHALILGGIGTAAALAGAAGTWNAGLGPHWYPVALVITALPSVWAGGWLRTKQVTAAA
jgi:hypothetical protein